MKNQITLKLLECKEGVYEGTSYSNVLARYGDRILRFKLDSKKVGNLEKLIDKNILATVDIVAGGNMAATIRIVEVVESK